jgi:copper(I)-binding protein
MMLELLLALAAEPATVMAQDAPATATAGDLTLRDGGMMAWTGADGLGGQVMFLVDNSGTDADRVLSVRTPAGTTGKITVYPIVNDRGEAAPEGDVSIRPGGAGVTADLVDLASGRPQPVQTTLTVVFERAGEVTLKAMPFSPPPPAPPSR